jgi:hypothetical protein
VNPNNEPPATVAAKPDGPILFTIDEVAARFRVSRRTLQAHVRQYPYYRVLGRRKLFTEADISRLYETLPCPSSSSPLARAKLRTGQYVAPISGDTLTEALKLASEQTPPRSYIDGREK